MTGSARIARIAGTVGVAALAAGFGGIVAAGYASAQPVVPQQAPFGQDPPPAADVPSAEQISGILTDLTDPAVPEQVKNGLVQGGFDRAEDHRLRHALNVAEHRGELPLSFQAANIASPSPGTATADVTVTGPRLAAPITKTLSFTNQNGWIVSYDSAAELVEEITGRPER